MTILIGSKVLVKDNAFGDSDHPDDIAARGKVGIVIWMEADGRIEVQPEDDDFLLLTVDEVEELSDD